MKNLIPESLPKNWKRVHNPVMEAMGASPDECPGFASNNGLFVLLTKTKEQDGREWVHLSVSRKSRIPCYDELCTVKNLFLGSDSIAYLLFVPRAQHVNIHKNCLHLWMCVDGSVTPDFTWGSGSI